LCDVDLPIRPITYAAFVGCDLIGVLGLAVITALGGGITRDILIQKGPPLAFLDVRYLLVALGAGIAALLFGFSAGPHMSRFIWVADAASLWSARLLLYQ
jgi:uncharacterized membrane protein YeiH